MAKIKNIIKSFFVFILIIPMAFIFCACGNKDEKDDKLSNTSNVENIKDNENNDENNITFPTKEFKNILTAVNYANNILNKYSFQAKGEGAFTSSIVREKLITKVSNSDKLGIKLSEIEIFKDSSVSANLGFVFQQNTNDNSLIFAQSIYGDENKKEIYYYNDDERGQIFYFNLDTDLEEYREYNSFVPGDLPIIINSESVGRTLTNLTKINDKYYCKLQLNINSAKKYLGFLNPYLEHSNISLTFKSCIAEIYFDQFSRYDTIKYDLSIAIDASAYPIIGQKFDAKISYTEKYTDYANLKNIDLTIKE